MEKVQVYVKIAGDYCAFHEMSIQVVYDITNDCPVGFGGDESPEELAEWDFNDNGGGYSDVEQRSAIKDGNKYYIEA